MDGEYFGKTTKYFYISKGRFIDHNFFEVLVQ